MQVSRIPLFYANIGFLFIEGCGFSHPAFVRLIMQCLQADLKTESSAEERDSIILILQPLLPSLLSQLLNFHCTSLQITECTGSSASHSSFSFGCSVSQQNDLQHALLSDFITTCRKILYFFSDYNPHLPITNALFLTPTT